MKKRRFFSMVLSAVSMTVLVIPSAGMTVTASKVPADVAASNPDDVQIVRPYIRGNETEGTTLQGNYTYYDVCGSHAESGTVFQWYRSDTKDGEYTVIPDADSCTYTLTDEDVGKYIVFEVAADNCEPCQSWMIGPVLSQEENSCINSYFDNDNDYMYNVNIIQSELSERLADAVYFTVDSESSVDGGGLSGSEYLYRADQRLRFTEGTKPVSENGIVYAPAAFFTEYLGTEAPDVEKNSDGYYNLKQAAAIMGKAYWSGDENQSETANFQMEHLGQGLIVIGGEEDIFDPVRDRDLINEACNMLYTLRATDEQMEWFRAAKYGMFLHWDPSSLAGIEISWDREAARPYDIGSSYTNELDLQYDTLYKQFNPTKYDPDEWMQLAVEAGMKYVVLTAKHHGSFSNFFTDYDNYSIEYTDYGKDIVKQFVDAAHKAGLKVGFYYSARDWYNPNYLTEDHHRYLEYYFGEIQELLTNYGDIDIMWFDSIGTSSLNEWDARTLLRRMKQLQPDLIVNNRYTAVLAGYEQSPYDINGDFYTPEHRLGGFDSTRPWESCMTVTEAPGGGWSYRPDGRIKTVEESVMYLINNVINDGNLLYNIGPMPSGELNEDHAQVFRETGEWLKPYSEAVYHTRGGPYINQKWGGSTYRTNDDGTQTIYLHVSPLLNNSIPEGRSLQLDFPSNGQVYCSAELVKDGTSVEFEWNEDGYLLTLPAGMEWDEWDTVIRLNPDLSGTLQNKISEARAYAETMTAADLAVFKEMLNSAADVAESVIGGGSEEQMSGQLRLLSESLERAQSAKVLSDMILSVEEKLKSVPVGTNPWECPQNLYDQLSAGITSGRDLLADSASEKEDFDAAVSSLEAAAGSLDHIMDAQAVQFSPETGELESGAAFTMSSPYEELQIRYTLDGSVPSTASTLYEGESLMMSGKALSVNAILVDKDNRQIGSVQNQTYLASQSMTNIAQEKSSAEATSIYSDQYTADKAADGSMSTRWATPDGTITAALELTFDRERTVNAALIKEYVEGSEKSRITSYAVEYWDKEAGVWKQAYKGGEGGASKACMFDSVTSSRFRLNIPSCMNVTIYEFALFDTEIGRLELTADTTSLTPGNTAQLTVRGVHADGSSASGSDITELTYYIDREDVASINESGVVQLLDKVNGSGTLNVWAEAVLDGKTVTSGTVTFTFSSGNNLALGKKAEASTVYGSGFEAEKAVDGSNGTRWASAAGTGEQILTIDLGAEMEMNRAAFSVYADRSDPLNYEVYTDFKIQYEKDGQWIDAYDSSAGTHKIVYPVFNGTEQYGQNREPVWVDSSGVVKSTDYIVDFETIKAQKIRLYSNNTKKDPSIIEFEIYNREGAGQESGNNLALRQPTAASSVYSSAYPPALATDGSDSSRWASAPGQKEYWLEVDFTDKVIFDTVNFKVYADAADDELYGAAPEIFQSFQIQYWDGEGWMNAYESSEQLHTVNYPDYTGSWIWDQNSSVYRGDDGSVKLTDYTVNFKPVSSSKIRLYSDNTLKDPSLIEFGVYRLKGEEVSEPVSRKTLEYFLNSAKEHMAAGDTEGLVESVRKLFDEAVAEGESVMADENATKDEVTNATIKLMKAIQALNFRAGDKTDLEMALELAQTIDLTKYIEAGQAEYLAAKEAAENVMADGDAMQDEVDAAWDALVDAMGSLRLKADKTALQELIDSLAGLDLSLYTEEGVQVYSAVFARANVLLADAALSIDEQGEVDAAVKELTEAKELLVLKEENQGGSGDDGDDQNPGGTTETPEEDSQNPDDTAGTSDTDNGGNSDAVEKAAKTGDPVNLVLWAVLLGASAAIFRAEFIKKKKHK